MKRTLVGIYGDWDGAELARVRRSGGTADDGGREVRGDSLAVLVGGTMPPCRAGSILCAVDGRLFETEPLAEELGIAAGSAPEEIAAAAYARWGEGALQRLRGEFILFLWDRDAMTGVLARDQLGTRSLYFRATGNRLTFASEVKDLLAALASTPAPDAEPLVHFIAGNPVPPGTTLFEGIRQLRPGHLLSLRRGRWQVSRYWHPSYRSPARGSRGELGLELRRQLERAVGRRMGGEDASAVIMSGGLDSTSIAAVAESCGGGRLRAYSGVFPSRPSIDESRWIEAMSRELDLETVRLAPEGSGLMADALAHIESWRLPPSGFGFWIPQLYQRAAADGATVVMTGDGGDELCEARPYLIADLLRSGRLPAALRAAGSLPGMGDYPPWRPVFRAFAKYGLNGATPHALDRLRGRMPWHERPGKRWLRPDSNRLLRRQWDPTGWKKLRGPRAWADISDRLMRRIQGLGLLDHVRREAERVGIEPAFPFFDLDLVEFALAVPAESLLSPYLRKPQLRTAMAGLMPDSVRLRLGKTVFDELTIDVVTGAERELVSRLVGDPGSELGAYADRSRLAELVAGSGSEGHEARRDRARDLWRLATVECWLRSLDDPGLASQPHWSFFRPSGCSRGRNPRVP